MSELCPMPGCRVEAITPDGPDLLHVDARSTRPGGRCPDCGRVSRAVHSRDRRRPADLPSLGRRVRVGLRVRRFHCRNARCARRTFAEHLPELAAPHARRTCRLGEAQGRVGAALGGAAGARLLQRLAMPASADTVLRWVRRLPLLEAEAPLGAPKAVQVADRWHALANVRDMLERWLARAHARLRRLPPPGDDGQRPGQRTRAFRPGRTATAAATDSRARWRAAYEDV